MVWVSVYFNANYLFQGTYLVFVKFYKKKLDKKEWMNRWGIQFFLLFYSYLGVCNKSGFMPFSTVLVKMRREETNGQKRNKLNSEVWENNYPRKKEDKVVLNSVIILLSWLTTKAIGLIVACYFTHIWELLGKYGFMPFLTSIAQREQKIYESEFEFDLFPISV